MVLNLDIFNKRSIPALLLIVLVGSIIYANTFQVPFVLDDNTSIVKNDVIKDLDNYFGNGSGYRFLPGRCVAFITFALNYHFGGLKVSGFHAVNLIIHLLTALLVYWLVRLSFRTPCLTKSTLAPQAGWVALLAALLFVAHPVQTQAVTYIVQRMTSLATMFYLLSLALYAAARLKLERADENPPNTGESASSFPAFSLSVVGLLAGAVLAAVLAMLTKPIAFTLPLAVLLYEASFFRGPWRRRLVCLLPLLATLPIVPITVFYFGHSGGGVLSDISEPADSLLPAIDDKVRAHTAISRQDYLFTQFRVIVTYLRLLILPINQNLDYDYPVYTSFFTPTVFLSFLLLAAIFALAVFLFLVSRPKALFGLKGTLLNDPALRLAAFGILWFFLTLSVESTIIPIADVIMEYRLYLPNFGLVAAFSTAFCLMAHASTRPGMGKLFLLFGGLLVLVLGYATFQRNHVWGDAVRLWQDVATKSPNKGRPINNLGVALEKEGRRPEAVRALYRAIEVDPNYYKAYYNLADLYLVSDQPDKALQLLDKAIQVNPSFAEAYVKAGAALIRGGYFREATDFLERNMHRINEYAEAHFYLGSAYVFTGNRDGALRELQIVSRLDTNLAASLAGLLGLPMNQGSPHGR